MTGTPVVNDAASAGPSPGEEAGGAALPAAVDALGSAPAGGPASLTRVCRALGLFALEGWSLGILLAVVLVKGDLERFVTFNSVGAVGRRFMLAVMFATALLAGAGGAVYGWRVRRRGGVARLEQVARRLAPVALVGFLPFLFQWHAWQGRELTFLWAAALFSFAAWAAARAALSSPPIFTSPSTAPVSPAGDCNGNGNGNVMIGRLVARLQPVRDCLAGRRWPWLPGAIVVVAAAGYTVLFSIYTITFHRNLHTAAYDLGLEDNLVWNVLHGYGFFRSTVFSGPHGSHFGNHATFFSYVIAPFYALAQRAETLLVIQSLLIAAAAVPLYLHARRHLGAWAACVIALCYLIYAPNHGANLYEFHYIPLGGFFIWSALYCFETRRDRLAVVMTILAMSVREDIGGAGVAILGAYMLIAGVRPRAGLIVAAAGALQFALLKLVFMPAVSGIESFIVFYKDLFPRGQDTFSGVLKTVFGNPFYTLGTLLERDKLYFLLQFFVPLAFIPFGRPIVLLLMVPGFFFTLLSTGYAPLIQASFQYTFLWTVFLFIGLVATLARPKPGATPVEQARRVRAALFALVCAMVPTSYQLGAVFQRHTARDLGDREKFARIVRDIPPRAKVTACDNLVPHVSNRPVAYTLRFDVFDADYILFFSDLGRIDGAERGKVTTALTSGDFGVVEIIEPFAVAKRGHTTALNNRVLSAWGTSMPAPEMPPAHP